MNVLREANVYVREQFAGVIQETDQGYCFTYDPSYLTVENPCAVSLILPLRAERYPSPSFFPFFDGLLPEGWLLHAVSTNWKIDHNDRFGLMMVACHDCIGIVSIREVRP